MLELTGLSGSLRKGSFNTALLRAAATVMPEGSRLSVNTIEDIPLYNGDDEAASGIPPRVASLKDAIASSAGLLLVSPEYNNSIPGPFKNAIDWLTRPADDIARVFGARPVAVIGASPGGFGTILGQNAWLPVLRTLGTRPWFAGRLMVSRAGSVFGADGSITDAATLQRLREFIQGFVEFAAESRK